MLILAMAVVVLNFVFLIIVSVGWLNDRSGIKFGKFVAALIPYVVSLLFALLYIFSRITITEVQ